MDYTPKEITDVSELWKTCFETQGTCYLLLSTDEAHINAIAVIKHRLRATKTPMRIYSTNLFAGKENLFDGNAIPALIAVNGLKGWYKKYEGTFREKEVSAWMDAVKMGEGTKLRMSVEKVKESFGMNDSTDAPAGPWSESPITETTRTATESTIAQSKELSSTETGTISKESTSLSSESYTRQSRTISRESTASSSSDSSSTDTETISTRSMSVSSSESSTAETATMSTESVASSSIESSTNENETISAQSMSVSSNESYATATATVAEESTSASSNESASTETAIRTKTQTEASAVRPESSTTEVAMISTTSTQSLPSAVSEEGVKDVFGDEKEPVHDEL